MYCSIVNSVRYIGLHSYWRTDDKVDLDPKGTDLAKDIDKPRQTRRWWPDGCFGKVTGFGDTPGTKRGL